MSRYAAPLVVLFALLTAACQDLTQPPGTADGPLFSTAPAASRQEAERVVAGQILARLVEGTDDQAVAANYGLQVNRPAASGGFTVFQGAAGNERALAARMGADVQVVWAEPNYVRQTTTIDSKLWAFYNPGGLTITFTRGRNKGDVVGSKISVNDADEDNIEGYGAGGVQVQIASIDTGVDFGHQEFLTGQLIAGKDFYSGDDDPSDENDHGTHTTGTMVGQNVGVAGVSGAGGNVKVVVYRVCGALGCPTSAIVDAIYAAADAGVVAMNLSLGGPSESQAEKDAIAYAVNNESGKGPALVIASAGNGGTGTVSCPACDPLAISVAASNWQDELSYYSNWGEGLDITAPGGEMYSNTTAEGGIWSSVRGGYAYFQGTSMAAPQVTGTAGVVASKSPSLRGSALRDAIEGSVDDLGASGYDTKFGHGRLNSYKAVMGLTLIEGEPPPNQPPVADFVSDCTDLTCNFTDQSSDDVGVVSWSWSFGDGNTSTAQNPTHTYASAGTPTVTLTVTDAEGESDSTSQPVTVSDPPPTGGSLVVNSCTPNNGLPNQQLTVSVTGSDFASGATVSFGNRVKVQGVTFVKSSQLDVLIKIHKRASGPRDVTVTNPDNTNGTGPDCFTVN